MNRADFPLLARQIDGRPIIYFDSAAASLNPHAVLDAQYRFASTIGSNVHRGHHTLAEEATAAFEGARRCMARFLQADPNCVIFVRGATEGINVIASGLGLSARDAVLVPIAEHHSNLLPWRRVARVVPLNGDPAAPLDVDYVAAVMARERPRVIAFSHASNVTGVVHSAKELCREARERGVISVVDASQSVAHMPIDVDELGCDFLVFGGQKMLGPAGIGILWGRHDLLKTLKPMIVGGGAVESVTEWGVTLADVPRRLEAGTPNIIGVIGLEAATRYLEAVGWDGLRSHESNLADRLEAELADTDGIRFLMARSSPRLALASFVVENGAVKPNELAAMLSLQENIMVRSGRFCAQPLLDRAGLSSGAVRVSAYLYNTEAEIGRLGEVLRRMLNRVGCGRLAC